VRSDSMTMLALGAAGVAVASTAAWVGYRTYLRAEVLKELEQTQLVRGWAVADYLSKGLGVKMNIPAPEELAKSLVPIWDTTSPYKAIEDVLQNGRMSRYWPAAYRESGDLKAIEPVLLQVIAALMASTDEPALLETNQ